MRNRFLISPWTLSRSSRPRTIFEHLSRSRSLSTLLLLLGLVCHEGNRPARASADLSCRAAVCTNARKNSTSSSEVLCLTSPCHTKHDNNNKQQQQPQPQQQQHTTHNSLQHTTTHNAHTQILNTHICFAFFLFCFAWAVYTRVVFRKR